VVAWSYIGLGLVLAAFRQARRLTGHAVEAPQPIEESSSSIPSRHE
jgi:hypothetical protein